MCGSLGQWVSRSAIVLDSGQWAIKGNAALLVVVSLVKGDTGLMVGRSISVNWLSTLFPSVTFLAKYRRFHKRRPRLPEVICQLSITDNHIKTFMKNYYDKEKWAMLSLHWGKTHSVRYKIDLYNEFTTT